MTAANNDTYRGRALWEKQLAVEYIVQKRKMSKISFFSVQHGATGLTFSMMSESVNTSYDKGARNNERSESGAKINELREGGGSTDP